MIRARDMLADAPHGDKGAVLEQAAALLQCSPATVYRKLGKAGLDTGRRRRSDAGRTAVSDADLMTLGATLMATVRDNGKQLWGTRRAMSALRANGLVQTELSDARVHAVLRERGLHAAQLTAPRATQQMRSPHPNWCWQIDSSTSVLYKDKTGRLRAMSSDVFYKNKPENIAKVINDLITRYVAADHASGAFRGRYYLGGESAENLIDFAIHAFVKGISPMHGVPLHIYTDQGPANKSGLWLNFCRNLGITLMRHEPGRANATGSVERHGGIWECGFEGGLPFVDQQDITLDWLNQAGEQWAAMHCATEEHSRHGMTRDAAWLLIRDDQLRVPASAELLRELASAEPEQRRVSNLMTVSARVKGYGSMTYSVRGVPGASPGVKVTIAINAYRAPAIDVRTTDAAGSEIWQTVEPEVMDRFGFPVDAPVLGQSFASQPNTQADEARNELLRRTYSQQGPTAPHHALPTIEQATRLRKQRAQAMAGRLDPMADVRATELPSYMPRRGHAAEPTARRVAAVLLSTVDAARRLREALGGAYGPHVYAWLQQRFADGVPEDQLQGLVLQFSAPSDVTASAATGTDGEAPRSLRIVAGCA